MVKARGSSIKNHPSQLSIKNGRWHTGSSYKQMKLNMKRDKTKDYRSHEEWKQFRGHPMV